MVKDGKTKGIIDILNAHDFVVVEYFIKSSYVDTKGGDWMMKKSDVYRSICCEAKIVIKI